MYSWNRKNWMDLDCSKLPCSSWYDMWKHQAIGPKWLQNIPHRQWCSPTTMCTTRECLYSWPHWNKVGPVGCRNFRRPWYIVQYSTQIRRFLCRRSRLSWGRVSRAPFVLFAPFAHCWYGRGHHHVKCSALTICHHGGPKLPQKIAFPRPAVLTALSSNHETRPQRAPSKKLSVTLFWCQIRMWFPVQVLWSTEVSKCFDFDSGCLYILYYIKCVSYICSYLLIFLHISCVSVSLRSSARSRRAAEMTTYFARPYDMKAGTLKDRLCAASPTLMLAVPLVWEKTLSKVWENLWKSLSCLALTLKHHKKTLKMNYSET